LLREKFLNDHPECAAQLRIAGCQGRSHDVHHLLGRGRNFLKRATWLPVCRACHDWIHAHGREAEEEGLLVRQYQDSGLMP